MIVWALLLLGLTTFAAAGDVSDGEGLGPKELQEPPHVKPGSELYTFSFNLGSLANTAHFDTLGVLTYGIGIGGPARTPINFYGFEYATEFLFTPIPAESEFNLLIGHQSYFRYEFLGVALRGGFSGNYGIYRGAFLRRDSTDCFIFCNDVYERKTFITGGLFASASPEVILFNHLTMGLNLWLNITPKFRQAGVSFGGGFVF